MKVIHTADLHLGQVIYQNYDRVDEHEHFFKQLAEWCEQERPDHDSASRIQADSAVWKLANAHLIGRKNVWRKR